MTPTATAVALEFSQGLHACLRPEQMGEVVERNCTETTPGVFHSRDFCDANMVLYAVFLHRDIDPASEGGMELHGALWDQAWNLTKSQDFRAEG